MPDAQDIIGRQAALTRALVAWGRLRAEMSRAHPGTNYDCWYQLGDSLCAIAQQIENDRERIGGEIMPATEIADGR